MRAPVGPYLRAVRIRKCSHAQDRDRPPAAAKLCFLVVHEVWLPSLTRFLQRPPIPLDYLRGHRDVLSVEQIFSASKDMKSIRVYVGLFVRCLSDCENNSSDT